MEECQSILETILGLTSFDSSSVAQVVEADRPEPGTLEERREGTVAQVRGIDDCARLCSEDEAAKLVEVAHTLHLFQLAGEVRSHGRHRARREPSCRWLLRGRGIRHTIPERRDQQERRMRRPGRPPSFGITTYARRNVVERCVNRLKQWRGIATRYEKRAVNYRAAVVIAALMIWLAS
jgi:transposase